MDAALGKSTRRDVVKSGAWRAGAPRPAAGAAAGRLRVVAAARHGNGADNRGGPKIFGHVPITEGQQVSVQLPVEAAWPIRPEPDDGGAGQVPAAEIDQVERRSVETVAHELDAIHGERALGARVPREGHLFTVAERPCLAADLDGDRRAAPGLVAEHAHGLEIGPGIPAGFTPQARKWSSM